MKLSLVFTIDSVNTASDRDMSICLPVKAALIFVSAMLRSGGGYVSIGTPAEPHGVLNANAVGTFSSPSTFAVGDFDGVLVPAQGYYVYEALDVITVTALDDGGGGGSGSEKYTIHLFFDVIEEEVIRRRIGPAEVLIPV